MKRKKIFAAVCLAAAMVISIFNPCDANAYVIKPDKVSAFSTTRSSKNSLTLNWGSVYNANGYQVAMKAGQNGTFKTLKATNALSKEIGNLNVGETYYFKARAYTKKGKKKYYGKYSNTIKNKLNEWVYLSDVMKPYAGGSYSMYTLGKYFTMAGQSYTNGFVMETDYNDVHDLYLNLNGEYSSMSFDWGCVDGREDKDTSTIQIYEDDNLIDTLSRNKNDLVKSYILDVRDTYKLRFIRSEGFNAGFGNVKLYY